MLHALRANHIVCLLCDRDIVGGGIEVEFFGERTTLPGGPATLALRTGAALCPTAVYYEGALHRAVIGSPRPLERTGRMRDDVTRLTQGLAAELEGLIRRADPHTLAHCMVGVTTHLVRAYVHGDLDPGQTDEIVDAAVAFCLEGLRTG